MLWRSRSTRHEAAQGTVVRLHADGADHRRRAGHAGQRREDHQRPRRPAHAVAGGGGDHAGLSHRLHADGHGHAAHLAGLRPRLAPHAGPDGAVGIQGDGQRRADCRAAVRLHGLSGRACQPDPEAVSQPAPVDGARAGVAGGGHAGHLRGVCHRHRHRRRRGHLDGPAGAAGHAARRLQRAAVGRRHHGGRLPGHPDSTFGAADRVRRHGGRVGGAVVRGRVLPRPHAGRPVRAVRHHRRQPQARLGAAAERQRSAGGAGGAIGQPGRAQRTGRHGLHAAHAAPRRFGGGKKLSSQAIVRRAGARPAVGRDGVLELPAFHGGRARG